MFTYVLNIIWDTSGYFFWLLTVSLLVLLLERVFTWRKAQKVFRLQFVQDLFWLVFNGHYAGLLLAYVTVWVVTWLNHLFQLVDLPAPESWNLLASSPLWVQFIFYFILADFIEWCVHNLLHRVSWMWEFHKLHHSITEMDWIGNFRFHWMEIVIYKSFKYIPLIILGVDSQVIFLIAVVATLIGHLNHANIRVDWGILRYIFNSPRLHIWHHDREMHYKHGQNFAIVFSLWDWLFGTIYYPESHEAPEKLGFHDIDKFPRSLYARLIYPFIR